MGKIVAVDIGDQPDISPRAAIVVIDMPAFPDAPARGMREIWHGSKEDAMALRDALDALLPASAPARPAPKPPKVKKTPQLKKDKATRTARLDQGIAERRGPQGQRGSEAGCYG